VARRLGAGIDRMQLLRRAPDQTARLESELRVSQRHYLRVGSPKGTENIPSLIEHGLERSAMFRPYRRFR
jgi:hypothetical protein